VSAWEWLEPGKAQIKNAEQLTFEEVALTQRSYK
jgi:hypothetical protein